MIFILRFCKVVLIVFFVGIFTSSVSNCPIKEVTDVQPNKLEEVKGEEIEQITQNNEIEIENKEVIIVETKEVKQRPQNEVTTRSISSRPKISIQFSNPCEGKISQGFTSKHAAIDICNDYGTEIKATADGICILTKEQNYSYGNHIIIQHDDNTKTLYAHLSSINVEKEENVKQGEVIGFMGSTGNSTGNHLHYEIIYDGERTNPKPYVNY